MMGARAGLAAVLLIGVTACERSKPMTEKIEQLDQYLAQSAERNTPENQALAAAEHMEVSAERDPALAVAIGDLKSNLILNGFPCDRVADNRPVAPATFEVTCIEFRAPPVTLARYRVDARTGRATKL